MEEVGDRQHIPILQGSNSFGLAADISLAESDKALGGWCKKPAEGGGALCTATAAEERQDSARRCVAAPMGNQQAQRPQAARDREPLAAAGMGAAAALMGMKVCRGKQQDQLQFFRCVQPKNPESKHHKGSTLPGLMQCNGA